MIKKIAGKIYKTALKQNKICQNEHQYTNIEKAFFLKVIVKGIHTRRYVFLYLK